MKKLRRRLALVALVLFGLMLFVLGVSKIVHRVWNEERAARTITHWASKGIAGRGGPTHEGFVFGRVEYPWLPAVRSLFWGPPVRVDVWDVTIWDPDGGEVLHADHVQTGLELDTLVWDQLRGALPFAHGSTKLHFVDALVERVRCNVKLHKGEKANIVAAFARSATAPPKKQRGADGGFVVSVARSTIVDGHFSIGGAKWSGELDHFAATSSWLRYSTFANEQTPGRPAFTYAVERLETEHGDVRIEDRSFPLDHFVSRRFGAFLPRSEDMVIHATMRCHGAPLAVDGKLADLYTKQRTVELALHATHLAGLLASLPTRSTLSGDGDITAHVSGPFSDIVIEGKGKSLDAKLAGIAITDISLRYRIERGVIDLHDILAKLLDGVLRGEVDARLHDKSWSADLTTHDIHLLEVKRLLPVTLFAYVASTLPRLVAAAKANKTVTEKIEIGGVDVTMYQSAHDPLPTRFVLHGKL